MLLDIFLLSMSCLAYQCNGENKFKIGGLISELTDLYYSKSIVFHSSNSAINGLKSKELQR